MQYVITDRDRARFWSKVLKAGLDDCWLWNATITAWGYGQFGIRWTDGKIHMTSVHRLSYVMEHGDIAGDLHVRHKCDVRRCVNPAHLILGTHLENMQDMVVRERAIRKLTREQAEAIRFRRAAGEKGRALAKEFGVSEQMVCDIFKGRERL